MTDKVQKIREKIEIVVNRRLNLLNGDYFDLNEETDGFTNEITDIIDSLQEELVSEELEKAANAESLKWAEGHSFPYRPWLRQCFINGSKWQKEQMMSKAINAQCFGFQNDALFSFRLPAGNYLVGSEVKIIVIKKD